MSHELGLAQGLEGGVYADLADGIAEATLLEAAKIAENVLAPLNRIGDRQGAKLTNEGVVTTPGWPQAYKQWADGGWNAITGPTHYGGLGLPALLNTACNEIWNAANMAFSLCPLLTLGAIEALQTHATAALKDLYLGRLVSGEWTGTMNLTEPQAGSDLSAIRTRAEPQPDGSFKLFGSKIFITYGDHDLTGNIIHFVLARLPDAPPGTRGISLFLVPKFLVNADGSLGPRNDVYCVSLEHKLGIHASPTCTMAYGEHGGALGWLIGEPNKGLVGMFIMMNNARLNVGVQGVAIADRAFQQALAYARERRQGRAFNAPGEAMSPIVQHPDVRRMLMTMKALTAAARAICLMTAHAIDVSRRDEDADRRLRAATRASLLTPIAKAFSTDIGVEAASLGIQIHGGMGFIEETGAAQLLRDSRIAPIYEGTNGIQAIDLVMRKVAHDKGDAAYREIREMKAVLGAIRETDAGAFGDLAPRLDDAVDSLERATAFLLENAKSSPDDVLAGAAPYLRLFALALGGIALARGALAAHRLIGAGDNDPALPARIATARFFAEHIAPGSAGLELSVTRGAASVNSADFALAG